jgi:phosphoinositide-3-kinase, regulatory subunit 4
MRVHQCVIHPTKGRGKWVMVALESARSHRPAVSTLVQVWDIEKSHLVESFDTCPAPNIEPSSTSSDLVAVEANITPAMAIAALVNSHQTISHHPSQPPSANIRALIVGLDLHTHHRADNRPDGVSPKRGGFMVCGSEDRTIRIWDLNKPSDSILLGNGPTPMGKPSFRWEFIALFSSDSDLPVAQLRMAT